MRARIDLQTLRNHARPLVLAAVAGGALGCAQKSQSSAQSFPADSAMVAPASIPADAGEAVQIAADAGSEALSDGGLAPVLDAGASGSSDSGAPSATDAATPPLPLEIEASATFDGGTLQLAPGKVNAEVPVDSAFEIDTRRLEDVRVRLFDDSDRVVPSKDRIESAQRTHYWLAPSEPLVQGSHYVLSIDGQVEDFPRDKAGHSYDAVRIELQTAGQKPVSEKPKKNRRRR